MDLLDKSIILELMYNSRASCQNLAEKFSSSRGVVRKRIERLQDIGVIEHFTAWYSLAMIEANLVLSHITTDQQTEKDEILRNLERNPMIHAVIPTVSHDFVVHAEAISLDGLSNLGVSIRKLRGVNKAELHPIQFNRGKKFEMKKIHLRVMSALFLNSRLSGAEIARRTALSPRSVRRALNEIVAGQGIIFGIARNPGAESGLHFYVKTTWDDRKTEAGAIIKQTQQIFPEATWESYVSACSPTLFTRFFVGYAKDAERISSAISGFEGVESIENLVLYPARVTSSLSRERLKDDILNAGFSFCPP